MFNPPKQFLKEIGFDDSVTFKHLEIETKEICLEIILPTYLNICYYVFFLEMIAGGIKGFYNLNYSEFEVHSNEFFPILYDALMNAAKHGNDFNPTKKIYIGWWLGSKGILFAIKDEGDFYRSGETKKLVESRTVISGTKKDSMSVGLSQIYRARQVFVSTKENTLYFLLGTESYLRKIKKRK